MYRILSMLRQLSSCGCSLVLLGTGFFLLTVCGQGASPFPNANAADNSVAALDTRSDRSLGEEDEDDDDAQSRRRTLTITKAKWDDEDKELKVKGRGGRQGEQITVANAATGIALGVAIINDEGKWKFELKRPDAVPCAVIATAGSQQSESGVRGAPEDCDQNGEPGEPGEPPQTSHAGRFTIYEGSKTCNECHDQSLEVHASVHYQWQGPTPHVVNMDFGGKLGGINDFCGYPDINFLGLLTNLNGETIDGGCALCHVGMGKMPSAEPTQEQLENIDCLICHSDSYRRKVVRNPDGSFAFAPAPERMTVPLLQAITDIQEQPTRGACVNCHAYAGGGCNNKRGDLEEAHRNPPNAAFDVHMASESAGGAGLLCQDCHISEAHRFAGRGVDLRPTDLDVELRCTNCHSSSPHDQSKLNDHTDKVDCATCHIPVFAKITSTDMYRDYSRPPQILEEKMIYEPYMERQANVVPEYRFWNGLSTFYQFATPYVLNANGRVLMAGPVGDITDPNAKIFPFKHHLAVQPYDVDTDYLLPMRLGILFQTGDVHGAIVAGAQAVGWPMSNGYDFVQSERLMGIFHEVSPADNAVSCNDCHSDGGRMDFAALGYTPLPARNPEVAQNCASGCHGDESDEWAAAEFFTEVHEQHVDDENINCSVCHNYN